MSRVDNNQPLQDLHVRSIVPLVSPGQLKEEFPVTASARDTIARAREQLVDILEGRDPRLVVVVGPCSIHDVDTAMEYASRLKAVSDAVADRLFIVMRVYFEKPRTTVGWKGLINDPHMDDSFDVQTGFRQARKLLLDIADLGLPAATELLEPVTPQYIADLITLTAIGARTTESPTHRQMASGLSMPVGYKNGTDGGLQIAIDAMISARSRHSFLGIDSNGKTCVVNTTGNPQGHIILRGGRKREGFDGPNYQARHVAEAAAKLSDAGLCPRVMVDCSHANSDKDYRKQHIVWNDVVGQRASGSDAIMGLMLESNLNEGSQKLVSGAGRESLQRGVSVTDGCIGWDETERLLREAHSELAGQ